LLVLEVLYYLEREIFLQEPLTRYCIDSKISI